MILMMFRSTAEVGVPFFFLESLWSAVSLYCEYKIISGLCPVRFQRQNSNSDHQHFSL